jgi:hypothetical protein
VRSVLYLIPGVASTILFVLMWRGDLLTRPGVVGLWWFAGLLLQFYAGSQSMLLWLAGLLTNVTVAVYLSIRLRLP